MQPKQMGVLFVVLASSVGLTLSCAVGETSNGDPSEPEPHGAPALDAGRDSGGRTVRDAGSRPADASVGDAGSSADASGARDSSTAVDGASAVDSGTVGFDAGPIPDGGGVTIVPAGQLLNIDFGSTTTTKSGTAALGAGPSDQWNAAGPGFQSDYTLASLNWATGTAAGVSMRAENLPGNWGMTGPALNDPMWTGYSYSWSGANAWITLTGLPSGTYDFLLYGHEQADTHNTGFSVEVYQAPPDAGLNDGGSEAGAPVGGLGVLRSTTTTLYTTTQNDWNLPYWRQGSQYVKHSAVAVSSGDVVRIVAYNGTQGTSNAGCIVNGVQVFRQ